MDPAESVMEYYSQYDEWSRLERHFVEFELNKRFINKYIKNGDAVLDIGGGPGRYAIDLAKSGCKVTLLDLMPEYIEIAKAKALEAGVAIEAICADARNAEAYISGQFDAVLLMGPLYHLPDEADRIRVAESALRLLKPGGILIASFISSYAVPWDCLSRAPEHILEPDYAPFFNCVLNAESFSGLAFTAAHFIEPMDIIPFMSQFPLHKLHLLGSESILGFWESSLTEKPPSVISAWLDFAEKLCEREEFMCLATHLLYIGRKR